MRKNVSGILKAFVLMCIATLSVAYNYEEIVPGCPNGCYWGRAVEGRCVCDVGWTGQCCDMEIDQCPHCSGRGRKIDGRCVCDEGWGGECCEERYLDKQYIYCSIDVSITAEAAARLGFFAKVTSNGDGTFHVSGSNLAYDCEWRQGNLMECTSKDCSQAIRDIVGGFVQ